jgi:hypothetical protein
LETKAALEAALEEAATLREAGAITATLEATIVQAIVIVGNGKMKSKKIDKIRVRITDRATTI